MIIKDGDKFSVADLREMVDYFTSRPIQSCFVDVGSGHQERLLTNITPKEYEDNQFALYGKTGSSARDLDKNLRDAGYKTTYKFAYDYSIPGLTSEEIVRDAYRLEYFYKLALRLPRIKRGSTSHVEKIVDGAARASYYYAQYIWAANPTIKFDYAQRFDVYQDWGLVLSFLLGVGYQIHPKDVYEFVTHHNDRHLSRAELDLIYKKQEVFKNWCAQRGIDTGCLVFCPEHREKLRKILTKKDTPYWIQKLQSFLPKGRVR